MTRDQELELIGAAIANSEEAKLELLKHYDRLIWKMLSRFNYDQQLDLHSTCQIRLLECLTEFNPARGTRFITFLYHELRTIIGFHAYRRKFQSNVKFDDVIDNNPKLVTHPNIDLMKDALKLLPDMHRRIIYLLYYEDMTVREAARELRLTHSMVNRRAHEALKMLRVAL